MCPVHVCVSVLEKRRRRVYESSVVFVRVLRLLDSFCFFSSPYIIRKMVDWIDEEQKPRVDKLKGELLPPSPLLLRYGRNRQPNIILSLLPNNNENADNLWHMYVVRCTRAGAIFCSPPSPPSIFVYLHQNSANTIDAYAAVMHIYDSEDAKSGESVTTSRRYYYYFRMRSHVCLVYFVYHFAWLLDLNSTVWYQNGWRRDSWMRFWYCACHMTKNIHRKMVSSDLFHWKSFVCAFIHSAGSCWHCLFNRTLIVVVSRLPFTRIDNMKTETMPLSAHHLEIVRISYSKWFRLGRSMCVCVLTKSEHVRLHTCRCVYVCKVLEIDLFRVFFNQWKDHPLSSGSRFWFDGSVCLPQASEKKKRELNSRISLPIPFWRWHAFGKCWDWRKINWTKWPHERIDSIFNPNCGANRPNRKRQC